MAAQAVACTSNHRPSVCAAVLSLPAALRRNLQIWDDTHDYRSGIFVGRASNRCLIFGQMKDPLESAIIYALIPHYHWFVTLKSHNGLIDLK